MFGNTKRLGTLLLVVGFLVFCVGMIQIISPGIRSGEVSTESSNPIPWFLTIPPSNSTDSSDYEDELGAGWDSGTDSGSWGFDGTDSGSWDSGGFDSGSWDYGSWDTGGWDSGSWDSGGWDSGGTDSGSW